MPPSYPRLVRRIHRDRVNLNFGQEMAVSRWAGARRQLRGMDCAMISLPEVLRAAADSIDEFGGRHRCDRLMTARQTEPSHAYPQGWNERFNQIRYCITRNTRSDSCDPISRKERRPLRQHRQHRLRPHWASAGLDAGQVDGCRHKRRLPNPRNVVLSRVRAQRGRC